VILTFLAINGFRVEASDRELAGWVIGLSAGTTSEQLAELIRGALLAV